MHSAAPGCRPLCFQRVVLALLYCHVPCVCWYSVLQSSGYYSVMHSLLLSSTVFIFTLLFIFHSRQLLDTSFFIFCLLFSTVHRPLYNPNSSLIFPLHFTLPCGTAHPILGTVTDQNSIRHSQQGMDLYYNVCAICSARNRS